MMHQFMTFGTYWSCPVGMASLCEVRVLFVNIVLCAGDVTVDLPGDVPVDLLGDVPVHPKVPRPAGHLRQLAPFCHSSHALQPRNCLALAPGISLPSFISTLKL